MNSNIFSSQQSDLPFSKTPIVSSEKRAFDYSPVLPNVQQRQTIFDTAYLLSSKKLKAKVPIKNTILKFEATVNNCQQGLIKSSATYKQLEDKFKTIKDSHSQKKKKLEKEITEIRKDRIIVQQKKQDLINQRNKQKQALKMMANQLLNLKANNNLIMETIEQRNLDPEYNHSIDPDRMTYQQLLQLQEKIGVVSRGIQPEEIDLMPKHQYKNTNECEQQKMCTICFQHFEENQQLFLFQCKHKFHTKCMKQWLAKEKKCPNCKRQISFI